MAKLSAHGKELLRLTKVTETLGDPDVLKRRVQLAYMSDGVVLRKFDWWWKDTGKQVTGTWKLRRRNCPTSEADLNITVAAALDADPPWEVKRG